MSGRDETGGGPAFTREYVVRGERPRGPVCPGAVLFSSTGIGMGMAAACDLTGSGGADPTDVACFFMPNAHALSSNAEYYFQVTG